VSTILSPHSLEPLDSKLRLLRTPEPPYYVAISTNIHHGNDYDQYQALLDSTFVEANKNEGYLGMDSCHETLETGEIYSISAIYFSSPEALNNWRHNVKHIAVKKGARQRWFTEHNIRICQVLEHYGTNLTEKHVF